MNDADGGKYRIFDNMIEGVQIIDPEWRYLYVNHAVARHGRKKREELIGQKMVSVFPGIDQTKMFEQIGVCMKERRYVEMSNEFEYSDGSIGYFELRMEPVAEGVIILSFDITALKEAEFALRNINKDLENKVRERTSELLLKNKELEQFAYVASHDLQEPLRSLTGFAEVLQKNYRDKLDERANQSLTYLVQATARMKNLIVALLEYSRIGQAGKKESRDIGELVHAVLQDLHHKIEEKHAVIHVGSMPVISVYPVEFRLLLQNLIENALKYAKPSVDPVIKINARQEKGMQVFSITDNGMGIEEKYAERIFLIFQRLHTQKEISGTGIGLAHCRKIVELHEGRIWVEPNPSGGSIFYFEIPEHHAAS